MRDSDFRADTAETYDTATEVVKMGLGQIRIALVDLHRENDEMNEFGLTVARNRGANAKVFFDEAGAIEWLTADS